MFLITKIRESFDGQVWLFTAGRFEGRRPETPPAVNKMLIPRLSTVSRKICDQAHSSMTCGSRDIAMSRDIYTRSYWRRTLSGNKHSLHSDCEDESRK